MTATADEQAGPRDRRAEWLRWLRTPEGLAIGVLLVMTAVGGWLRFTALDRVGLWFDEWITVEESQRDTLMETVTAEASHPPVLRLMVRASIHWFGDIDTPGGVDVAARLPSALLGTLAIVMIFVFARRYSGGSLVVGLGAAALWAFGGYGIYYSQEARYYAGMVLFAAWALHGVAMLRENPRHPGWHLYTLVPLLLGPLNHALFGVLFLLSFVGVVPLILRNIRQHAILVLPWVAAGLMYLPWFVYSMQHLEGQARPWLEPVSWQTQDIPVAFFTGRIGAFHLLRSWPYETGYVENLAWCAMLLLVLGFVIHLARRWRGLAWLSAFIVIATLVGTAAIHDEVMELRFFQHKYLSFIYPFVCLGVGELLAFLIAAGQPQPRPQQQLPPATGGETPSGSDDGRGKPGDSSAGATADDESPTPAPHPPWQKRAVGWVTWGIAMLLVVTHVGPVADATAEAIRRMRPGAEHPFVKEPYREAAAWAEQWRPEGAVAVVFAPHYISDDVLAHYGIGDPLYAIRKEHIADPSTFWQSDPPPPGSVSVQPARCIAIDAHCDDEGRKLTRQLAMERYPRIIREKWFAGAEGWIRVTVLDMR